MKGAAEGSEGGVEGVYPVAGALALALVRLRRCYIVWQCTEAPIGRWVIGHGSSCHTPL